MSNPINTADYIPSAAPTPVISIAPLVLRAPGRAVDLDLKISAPITGENLPILLLSHGHGQSMYLSSRRGYNPLVDFYAARGFVVIQPTHQDSKALGLDPAGPEGALFWRSRAQDMKLILDNLDEIEAQAPGIAGRLDRNRIVAAGHSMGGHTVGMLLGMVVNDPVSGDQVSLRDERVKAGVMLAPPGLGKDIAAFAGGHYPVLGTTTYDAMTGTGLVVAGDKDQHPNFSERHDWRADAYTFSPGSKSLLTLYGAEHSLGGVSGYDVAEATDADPERLGLVQRLTWAYLRSAVYPEDTAWADASAAMSAHQPFQGRIDSK